MIVPAPRRRRRGCSRTSTPSGCSSSATSRATCTRRPASRTGRPTSRSASTTTPRSTTGPQKSTASIYLNCLLYRELLAYGYLLEESGRQVEANRWRGRAQDLADAVNTYCWDERDGTFYSVDLALRPIDEEDWLHSGAPRRWSSLLLRIDNWSSFLPLWAGFASQEQAERMRERYLDRAHVPRQLRRAHAVAPREDVRPAGVEQPVELARPDLGHQQLPRLPRAAQVRLRRTTRASSPRRRCGCSGRTWTPTAACTSTTTPTAASRS